MLHESAETKLATKALADDIATFAQWMCDAYRRDVKVILFGNGVPCAMRLTLWENLSAATIAHIVCELVEQ